MRKQIIPILTLVIMLSIMIGCGKQTAEQMFSVAENLEKEEKYQDALVKFEKILVVHPNTPLAPEIYFKIAQLTGTLKKFENCVDAYAQIVKLAPGHQNAPKAQFMIGYIYANELKNTEKAREAYTAFIEKYSAIDSGMTASAEFELKFLGKDISEIDFLKNLTSEETAPPETKAKGN
jgi:TolA-binding protein